jgi:hypothetical protein
MSTTSAKRRSDAKADNVVPLSGAAERSASLAPLLATLTPHLPPAVVSPAASASMLRAAEELFPVSGLGFEARLTGDPSEVDLCIRVIPEDGSAAILTGTHPSHALSAPLAADFYWQRLARLSRILWGAEDGLLRPCVNRLGLEVDKADLEGVGSRPSIAFFDLPETAGPQATGLLRTITDIVLPLALERSLAPEQRACLARVVAAALPFARLRHVGASLTRPDPAIRLVFWLKLDQVGACLAALGFGGRAALVGASAAVIGGPISEVALQVDVTEALGPRIGIEYHAERAETWKGLLNRLAAHRLCTVERAVALAGWQRAPSEINETNRSAYSSVIPQDPARLGDGLPVRLLSHAKLSFMPKGSPAAKIYLYAGFLWRS